MPFKALFLSLGCLLTCLLLPVVAISGTIALFLYAAFVELIHLLSGTTEKHLDPTSAHETAVRICGGYDPRRAA